MRSINFLVGMHSSFFAALTKFANGWLIGLFARLTFLAVLYFYFLNSAKTKVGEGFFGFFQVQDGAYFQILTEKGMAAYDFDAANVPFFYDLIVYFGTYSEFILPLLIVIGLFTRVAAFGMIIFILVQSYVDIAFHGVDAATRGMLFDRDSASVIMDQRALWIFLLLVLALKGAGAISLDSMVSKWWRR